MQRPVSWHRGIGNLSEVMTVHGLRSKKCLERQSLAGTNEGNVDQCSKDGDRDGMKEAARNHKALDGVIKTLRWTLGEEG